MCQHIKVLIVIKKINATKNFNANARLGGVA